MEPYADEDAGIFEPLLAGGQEDRRIKAALFRGIACFIEKCVALLAGFGAAMAVWGQAHQMGAEKPLAYAQRHAREVAAEVLGELLGRRATLHEIDAVTGTTLKLKPVTNE